jgi:two-component system, LytTR family, sensor histidine kinase AlgZ
MSHRRRYWLRILLANTAGALAVVGVNGGFAPGYGLRNLARAVIISLVYANCIGTVLAIMMPRVAGRCLEGGRARWPALLAAMAALTIAATFAATVILFAAGVIPRAIFGEWLAGAISTSLVISLIIGAGITAFEILRGRLEDAQVALRTKERDEADARRIAAEAQLASLESRVQPHFLFNTLNSIASLIHEDAAGAERMTTQLASLMRASLAPRSSALVPLEDELQVVRDYLDIERVRFGERLRYDIHLANGAASALVPRLSLQTLVENSVKYAVSPSRDGATIELRVEHAGDRVRLAVEDNGPGFDGLKAPDGHGLALLKSRIELLFGADGSMHVDSAPGRTVVTMIVPSSHQPPATDHQPLI